MTTMTRQGWFWAIVPVVLLSATAVSVLVVVSIALDDNGFSVEKDYYKKALNYDAELGQRKHNTELGWHLKADVRMGKADAKVTAQLSDRASRPISGALLEAEAFALARGQPAERLAFVETHPGVYEAKLTSHRPGLWEVRISALSGAERFTKVVRTDAALSGEN